jgi:hypothetical protein
MATYNVDNAAHRQKRIFVDPRQEEQGDVRLNRCSFSFDKGLLMIDKVALTKHPHLVVLGTCFRVLAAEFKRSP